jgi:hypothetical protein
MRGALLRADFNRSMEHRQDDYMGGLRGGEVINLTGNDDGHDIRLQSLMALCYNHRQKRI